MVDLNKNENRISLTHRITFFCKNANSHTLNDLFAI